MENIKLYEDFNQGNIEFDENQLKRIENLWSKLHYKYVGNPFFLKLYNKAKNKRHLTKNQWLEFNFLLNNGMSRYEAGVLPKNY